MKYIVSILIVISSFGYKSQGMVGIKIKDFSDLQCILVMGELFKPGMKEVYYLSCWGDEFKQGYIVLNFHRKGWHSGFWNPSDSNNHAMMLLDSLDISHKMRGVDLEHSNWSKQDKDFFNYLWEHQSEMEDRFTKHVKVYVEKESLVTGISYKSFLKYE